MSALIGLIFAALGLLGAVLWNSIRRPLNYPPGPQWWPCVGNTYQLRNLARKKGGQHIVFEEWSKQYNSPVIGLKLGCEYFVIGFTYPIVHEIQCREEFEGRPDNFFIRMRTMGTRLGITFTDGPLWAEHRTFTTRHLRQAGYGRMPMEIQIQNQLNDLISVIKDLKEEPVWPGGFLPPSIINVLWALVAGTRISRNDPHLEKLLDLFRQRSKIFDLAGGLLAQIPWLRFIAPEKTGYNLIKRFNAELYEFFMKTVNEHKANYTDEKENDDLVYAYLKEMKRNSGSKDSTFTDKQLIMTILDIFIAGFQTTSVTLDLAFMMMVIRPDIQERVFEEIEKGLESFPTIGDKAKLPYTQAVLMEVQRYFHIAPLSGPRRVLRDTTLGGYFIPKDTTVLIGLGTVAMDKSHWKDPENFRPERFLDDDKKIINDEYYMPFGQGPRWWPWVGNTYQLRNLARKKGGQHIVFEEWSKQYNSPVIGFKLGSDYYVIGLSYAAVREIHCREEFEGRPDNFFIRMRTMGTRLGITFTDGPLWAEHRSFTTRHLRQAGYGRMPMEIQIQNQLNDLLSVIKDFKELPVWPGDFLPPSVINVLWALAAGKRISRNDPRLGRLLDLFRQRSKVFDMGGGLLAQTPWLRFIAPEKTGYNLIKRFNAELYEFFMETVNEHKANYTDEKETDDLVYAYLKEMKRNSGSKDSTFTDKQLIMIILDIFIAGSQTTSITLDLAFMMMVIRPDIQERVFEEIEKGLESFPTIGDKAKLPYTQAVLMEVQRYFHIVPISGPRRALRDTTLGGYRVPKNATVLIGLRNVATDKNHWKDPENFRPERFLDDDKKIINDEYYMPFGQGKRRCLGDSLARGCLFTFFVGVLQKFQLVLPENEKIPDTVLQPGITLSPKPYNIKFIPR